MHLRVASYNLHKCRGVTGPHSPERNLTVIKGLQADVVALQEVDFRHGARPEALPRALVERMTGLVPADFNGTGAQSLGWHGQTILLRPDLAENAVVRRLPLPGIEPRGALALRLPGLTVVAVHLGLARSSRRAQLARLVAQVARLTAHPVAVMGDFNEWRDDRGLEPLEGWQMVVPGPTYPAPLPRLRLDRMALTPDIRLEAAGVFHDAPAREASDHLPIWADLSLH